MREAGTALSALRSSCATTHPRTPTAGMRVHFLSPCSSSRGKRTSSGGAISSSWACSAHKPRRSIHRPCCERKTSCSSEASSDPPIGQSCATAEPIRGSFATRCEWSSSSRATGSSSDGSGEPPDVSSAVWIGPPSPSSRARKLRLALSDALEAAARTRECIRLSRSSESGSSGSLPNSPAMRRTRPRSDALRAVTSLKRDSSPQKVRRGDGVRGGAASGLAGPGPGGLSSPAGQAARRSSRKRAKPERRDGAASSSRQRGGGASKLPADCNSATSGTSARACSAQPRQSAAVAAEGARDVAEPRTCETPRPVPSSAIWARRGPRQLSSSSAAAYQKT
mmetsp:Transcript_29164/g.94802  ORF Transcript_29164/g.94802 Transcript_29164/m.94802 type:complete len:338 (+) Transcript_29164:271-1284(+)